MSKKNVQSYQDLPIGITFHDEPGKGGEGAVNAVMNGFFLETTGKEEVRFAEPGLTMAQRTLYAHHKVSEVGIFSAWYIMELMIKGDAAGIMHAFTGLQNDINKFGPAALQAFNNQAYNYYHQGSAQDVMQEQSAKENAPVMQQVQEVAEAEKQKGQELEPDAPTPTPDPVPAPTPGPPPPPPAPVEAGGHMMPESSYLEYTEEGLQNIPYPDLKGMIIERRLDIPLNSKKGALINAILEDQANN